MNVITIQKPHMLTKLEIWAPKYSEKWTQTDEPVALLAQYKVQQASPLILIEFTKRKHLAGQRFCIKREDAMRYPLSSNTKIPCYAVPMSALASWQTAAEVRDLAFGAFND